MLFTFAGLYRRMASQLCPNTSPKIRYLLLRQMVVTDWLSDARDLCCNEPLMNKAHTGGVERAGLLP
jgi:hypothetical protein